MARTYDEALAKFTGLLNEFKTGSHSDINEDTTRLRFIDALFLECLDWDRYSQVETEEQTDAGTIDYSMNLNGTMLIVEAKRVSIGFKLPIEQGRSGRLIRTIESVASLGKDIDKALAQAARYALEKGSPFAAVTNGWQVIAFCTQLGPGVGWRKGRALVFESLDEIRTHFVDFWNTLSVEAIRRFELKNRLTDELPSSPVHAKDALHQYPITSVLRTETIFRRTYRSLVTSCLVVAFSKTGSFSTNTATVPAEQSHSLAGRPKATLRIDIRNSFQ
jgi:hypothetical protein